MNKPKRKMALGDGEAMNSEQACAYLGVSGIFLAKRRLDGDGPRYSKLGRKIIYRRRDLDAYLDRCARQSTSDTGKKHAA